MTFELPLLHNLSLLLGFSILDLLENILMELCFVLRRKQNFGVVVPAAARVGIDVGAMCSFEFVG